jgi:hypothetical protein
MTYAEFVALDINLATQFDNTEFDITIYDTDEFYKLEILPSPNADDTPSYIYAPSSLLKYNPDPSVKTYGKVVLNIGLGTFGSDTELSSLTTAINEVLASLVGVSTTAEDSDLLASLDVVTYDETYLTTLEYETITTKRQAAKAAAESWYTQVATLTQQLATASAALANKEAEIDALNEIIDNLN